MKIWLTLFCAVGLIGVAVAGERPNILFAFADDWGRHASVYAKVDGPGTLNDAIRTPNFDALAASGVLFKNAFVNSPSCTPCRSSILSGQHFWRTGTGAILHGAWDHSIPAWPLLLKENGYHIGYIWKAWSPGSPLNAPYGGSEHGYGSNKDEFNRFSQSITTMVKQGKSVSEAKLKIVQQVRKHFRDMMAGKKDGQPFAYLFGPTNVHRKWTKGSGKALWNIDPDDLKGKMPAFLPDVHEVRQDFADYLGEAMDLLTRAGHTFSSVANGTSAAPEPGIFPIHNERSEPRSISWSSISNQTGTPSATTMALIPALVRPSNS